MNETMVGDYPLVDISAREAKLKNIKYPMAGMRSHEVTVGVFRLSDRNTVYLHTGTPKDRYFTNITWSPDEKEIYIQELNRRQDTCLVEVYDAASGKHLRTLFTETNEKYVEPENPLIFIPGKPNSSLKSRTSSVKSPKSSAIIFNLPSLFSITLNISSLGPFFHFPFTAVFSAKRYFPITFKASEMVQF